MCISRKILSTGGNDVIYVPTIEGKKVVLREIILNRDAEEWFEVMKDPDMHLWTGNTVSTNKEDIRELL